MELLILEKIIIYKNKEIAINFITPQFNKFFKLMDGDIGRELQAGTTQSVSS